ncbi:hypothetical protein DFJ58DRAFT_669626, partial [Suillus subalutaceus]|uniref:uncharacterized protein n=1 Tax=Suillus subalutaceus TaxID=48586 RepID=UPI001B869975
EKYLGPQAKEASGLKNDDIVLEPSTIDSLIKYYYREIGAWNLKKRIDRAGITPAYYMHSSHALQIYWKAALKPILDLGETAFPEQVPAMATSAPTPSSLNSLPRPRSIQTSVR